MLWSLAGELVAVAGRNRAEKAKAKKQPAIGVDAADAPPASDWRCSRLNQSLMELGATLCNPRQPECGRCPVRKHCVAFHTDRIACLPNLGRRVRPTERRFIAFVMEHRRRFMVRQRPAGTINALLWEFPNIEVEQNATVPNPAELAKARLGLDAASLERMCVIKHSITRYRISLEVMQGILAAKPATRDPATRWLTLAELEGLAYPGAHRKILTTLIASTDCE